MCFTMNGKVLLQYVLPHRLLSRVVYHATRWTWRPWKNWLIGKVVQRFDVDMAEAEQADALAYPHFNAFFTRLLRADVRQCTPEPLAIVCPADGRISQIGPVHDGRIVQAKGRDYTVAELLADEQAAHTYTDGAFATIYLSPRDYHHVHMPLDGTLLETVHVPGRIFSVAPFTVEAVPRLFARNERLVCHFEGEHGPFAVILVGAMLVSSISTVWDGLVVPPYASGVARQDCRNRNIKLPRFAPLGHFNMGSTVIVLMPHGARMQPLPSARVVKVGQGMGIVSATGVGKSVIL